MKILIIGNGFDLAHGLPTKYTDFLEYLSMIKKMSCYSGPYLNFLEVLDKSNINNNIIKYVENLISEVVDEFKGNKAGPVIQGVEFLVEKSENKILKELLTLMDNNFWLNYFNDKQNIFEGWIDFESEISKVIKVLDKEILNKSNALNVNDSAELQAIVKALYGNNTSKWYEYKLNPRFNEVNKENLKHLRDNLYDHLNRLIRCLEIYLVDCICKIEIKKISPDLKEIAFDKVLSFNYTDICKTLYIKNPSAIEYDYIHGKADISNTCDTNNMVLGIDDYLDDKEKNNDIFFICFKKYFLRIHKETGCIYKEWLKNLQPGDEIEVFIFGHSLDITDKDILEEIINNKNTKKTTIFYRDDDNKVTYGSQIANLVRILTRDDLILKVYEKTVVFKQQQKFVDISD